MTLIIYDHETHRVYADRHRHHVGESRPGRVNKLIVPKPGDRMKFKAEDTGRREKVLVTSGTGSAHSRRARHYQCSTSGGQRRHCWKVRRHRSGWSELLHVEG